MGQADIALGGDHRPGHRLCVLLIAAIGEEAVLGEFASFVEAELLMFHGLYLCFQIHGRSHASFCPGEFSVNRLEVQPPNWTIAKVGSTGNKQSMSDLQHLRVFHLDLTKAAKVKYRKHGQYVHYPARMIVSFERKHPLALYKFSK